MYFLTTVAVAIPIIAVVALILLAGDYAPPRHITSETERLLQAKRAWQGRLQSTRRSRRHVDPRIKVSIQERMAR